jgi:phosphatidylglycerol---prolipoprotein diacylglyceryl transferase
MIGYIYWNPKKELFTLPIINYPILWYSFLFLLGFVFGYLIFQRVLRRYFYLFLDITNKDIISIDRLNEDLKFPKDDSKKLVANEYLKNKSKFNVIEILNNFINNRVENRIFIEKAFSSSILSTKKKIVLITDKLVVYMILATVIGARLGHLIFYEKPQYYLKNPLIIFKVWEGGLASHGAAVAILIALIFFVKELKKYSPKITYVHLLDFISPSIAFAGFCIRIGNFINQEIIGIKTNLFWAVVFLNPMEGYEVVPRHPVQLYEAFFYFIVFIILFYLSKKSYFLLKEGKLFSIFLISIFTFRFFIEFLKVKESNVINENFLNVGQILSIPFIIIGFIFLFWGQIKKAFS